MPPVLRYFLTVDVTYYVARRDYLKGLYGTTKALLRGKLSLAKGLLTTLLKFRHVSTTRLSQATLHAKRFLANAVPVIKRDLDSTSRTILTNVRLLGDNLKVTTVLVLLTRFLPLCLKVLTRLKYVILYKALYDLAKGGHKRTLLTYFTSTIQYVVTYVTLFFKLTMAKATLLFVLKNI